MRRGAGVPPAVAGAIPHKNSRAETRLFNSFGPVGVS